MFVALAPSLGGLAVLGHPAARAHRTSHYLALTLAAWLVAAVLLGLMVIGTRAVFGESLLPLAFSKPSSYFVLLAACLPALTLASSVLYGWGETWSIKRHIIFALLVSVGAAAIAPMSLLASVCAFQGNCL